jgi:hypothetical protein
VNDGRDLDPLIVAGGADTGRAGYRGRAGTPDFKRGRESVLPSDPLRYWAEEGGQSVPGLPGEADRRSQSCDEGIAPVFMIEFEPLGRKYCFVPLCGLYAIVVASLSKSNLVKTRLAACAKRSRGLCVADAASAAQAIRKLAPAQSRAET